MPRRKPLVAGASDGLQALRDLVREELQLKASPYRTGFREVARQFMARQDEVAPDPKSPPDH